MWAKVPLTAAYWMTPKVAPTVGTLVPSVMMSRVPPRVSSPPVVTVDDCAGLALTATARMPAEVWLKVPPRWADEASTILPELLTDWKLEVTPAPRSRTEPGPMVRVPLPPPKGVQVVWPVGQLMVRSAPAARVREPVMENGPPLTVTGNVLDVSMKSPAICRGLLTVMAPGPVTLAPITWVPELAGPVDSMAPLLVTVDPAGRVRSAAPP